MKASLDVHEYYLWCYLCHKMEKNPLIDMSRQIFSLYNYVSQPFKFPIPANNQLMRRNRYSKSQLARPENVFYLSLAFN